MARGFSPRLPIQKDDADGYALTKTAREAVKQNLKMLVLTVPGERTMEPNFGVGLRRWLFRPMTPSTFEQIATAIRQQVAMFLPFIKFKGIAIETAEQDVSLGNNAIRIRIGYSVKAMGGADELVLIERAGLG